MFVNQNLFALVILWLLQKTSQSGVGLTLIALGVVFVTGLRRTEAFDVVALQRTEVRVRATGDGKLQGDGRAWLTAFEQGCHLSFVISGLLLFRWAKISVG